MPGKMTEPVKLSKAQRQGLVELQAVHDDGALWVRPQWISGTKRERSAANFRSLMALGLVEGRKGDAYNPQGQWRWRITPAGLSALQSKEAGE